MFKHWKLKTEAERTENAPDFPPVLWRSQRALGPGEGSGVTVWRSPVVIDVDKQWKLKTEAERTENAPDFFPVLWRSQRALGPGERSDVTVW